MLKFFVRQQKIEILEREVIASDQIAFVTLKFTFDGDWKKFHKVVQFTQCDETYNRVLGTDGLSCLLPAELHAGAVKMSVFGYDAENTEGLRATTIPVTLNIRQSGFVGDDPDSPIPPTPDLYAQLLQKIGEVEDGKSAYEIAVANGFSGTESEWLDSLKGVDGKDGVDGQPGRDGADGTNGIDGANGSNGKSAYEIAVINGFSGTESEWLESLKGADGKDGVDGQPGKDGANGSDGKSAYQIAVANGFSGTETEWLESLKGSDGKDAPEIDLSGYATKDELQKLEENALYLENLILSGTTVNFITLFEAGENALSTYGEALYTFYNDGFRSLAGFSESYPNFCSAENGYTIYFNQADFGWASTVFLLSLKPVALTSNSHLILSYIVGATQETECYLVQKTDKSGAELAQYIYSEIAAGNAITIPFQWLYSDRYVSVMQSLETIESGEYYLAIQGTSDNSHPMIKSIKFLKG